MLDLFRKGPPPLARPAAQGERVRVAYSKRGPWFAGVVVESLGSVMKVRLDQAGVAYYVRQPKRWVDQELQKVIVAAPAGPVSNGSAFTFVDTAGKTYRWSRAELDDTILEGEGWDSAAMRKRINALAPGGSITVAGETLTRAGDPDACCSSCAEGKACSSSCTPKKRTSARGTARGKSTAKPKLTKRQRAEVTRAQQHLARRVR